MSKRRCVIGPFRGARVTVNSYGTIPRIVWTISANDRLSPLARLKTPVALERSNADVSLATSST